jgi:hypothetical protein
MVPYESLHSLNPNGIWGKLSLILEAGQDATRRFVEFFTANIRNLNTRAAYAQAVSQFLA